MSNRTKSFIAGAAILSISGLLVKLIGMLYRIPLTGIIGTQGIGLYQIGYPVYSLMLVASTSGLPAAISRQVAQKLAIGDEAGARDIFRVSIIILSVIGVVGTGIMAAGAVPIATLIGDRQGAPAILSIAPGVFVVALLSVYRGYYQGMQRMWPTAISQIVEQLGKLAIGLYLAAIWLPKGPEYGAAGALVGVTLSEVAALLLMFIMDTSERKSKKKERSRKFTKESFGAIGKKLADTAIPATIGASIMPIVGFIDTALVINRLTGAGYSQEVARGMFGILTGVVNTFANMPSVFSLAVCVSLVPAISAARAKGREEQERAICAGGIKMAVLVGLPSAVGLALVALPAVKMLYSNLAPGEPELAANLLRMSAASIFFLSVVQASTGALQGVGHASLPVKTLAAGAAVKVAANWALISMPSINIMGAPIGTVLCYAIAAILNVIFLFRTTGMRANFTNLLIKPIIAVLAMGVTIVLSINGLSSVTGSNAVITLVSLLAGVLVYCASLLLLGGITQEDLELIPGAARFSRFLPRGR